MSVPRVHAYRPAHRALIRRRRRTALAAGLIGLVVLGLLLNALGGQPPLRAPAPAAMAAPPAGDPFGYRPGEDSALISRVIAGEQQALFTASPGGAVATAARVARLRPLVNAAVAGSQVDPNLLEGLVFVESAGRPEVVAGGDPASAAGLTQILPATANTMLGLHVDVARSRTLTQAIAAAQARGAAASVLAGLERRRAAADQRLDPAHALAATVRYLTIAQARFGRQDLAFVSYHMGLGNLSNVLRAYDGGTPVPYTQLFFDTAPDHHPAAYSVLSGFSDQSWMYYWRVLGAAALMHLYRTDPSGLAHLASLQTALDSSAEVLHPPDHTPTYADPRALSDAYASGALRPLPANAAQLGLAYAPSIGAEASRLHAPAGLYRGLTPTALALLLELASRVRTLAHTQAPLTVTGAVTDMRYQQLLGTSDPPAASGWTFTIARRYAGHAQADALQAMLDRLQALNLIAWAKYPGDIEVTVASDAARVIARGI
jgi:hypothetical protein